MEDDELLEAYRTETQDQCSRAEEILLGVEDGIVTRPMMDNLFRIAHTIKGSGMGVGIEILPDFVHHWEDILTKTRELTFPAKLSDGSISLFLRCNDAVLEFVTDYPQDPQSWTQRFDQLRGELTDVADREISALLLGEKPPSAADLPAIPTPLDPPSTPALTDAVATSSDQPDDALERAMVRARRIAAASPAEEPATETVAETVASASPASVTEAAAHPVPTAEHPATNEAETAEEPSTALNVASGGGRRGGAAANNDAANETIRVKLNRVDLLIQRIGELAVQQQLVAGRLADVAEDLGLEVDSRKLGQLASEAHDIAMSLRMVPVQPMVRTLHRTCRDTALKLGKKVNFVTHGEDTEMDLALVQTTGDALMHLVRNAVDHGLETTEERAHTSKPTTSTVTLSVAQRGGNVEIEVSDDGRGIDIERIRQKAIKLSWIGETEHPSREQLFSYLFKPGFSTSAKITEFSGRGVGLDVVATSIAALDGSISVQSELGTGTTIRLTLPLSVAVVDVMRVQVGGQVFLIPLHTVQETVAVSQNSLRTTAAGSSTVLLLRGRTIPIHVLRDILAFDLGPPSLGDHRVSAIITNWRSAPIAFVVDEIEGRQQVVVKPLSPELSHIAGLSGCAILGDGRVGLILDLAGLITSRGIAA